MAVQFPQFGEDKTQGLVTGISQGMGIAQQFAQIGQIAAAKRRQEWEMDYTKGAYAHSAAMNRNLDTPTRVKLLNKGYAPLINKYFKGKDEAPIQFTAADLENEEFIAASEALDKFMADPNMSSKEKMLYLPGLLSRQRMALGDDAGAAKIAEDLLGEKKQGYQARLIPVGRDPKTNKIVNRNTADGTLSYADGTPYQESGDALMPTQAKVLPAEVVKEQAGFETLMQDTDEVLKMTKDAKFIGPVVGRWNQMKSKVVDNPEFTEISSRVGQMIRTAYALSGKQISDQEIARLQEHFWGQMTDPKGNFDVKMNRFKEYLAREAGIRKENYADYGYFVPEKKGGKAEAAPTTTPQNVRRARNPKTGEELISTDGGKTWVKP